MRIDTHVVGQVAIVSVWGDLLPADPADSLLGTVRDLLNENRGRILIDLGNVRRIDAAGVGELVQCLTVARNRGGSVKLVGLTRHVKDLLILTSLLTAFECFETETEAIASFHRGPAAA